MSGCDCFFFQTKQTRLRFENRVNGMERHLPRKWQIKLSLAWLKGCDIVVAKVRFNLYQSLANI